MATPYQFSPRIPVPPHPTPLSVAAYKALPNSKAKRPPIHNPYDKFTQPEFDAWIDNITGALKRALGQIEADDEPKISERTQEVAMTGYRPLDLDESEDEALNDSFAEIKARRLLGNGKARDPREGPGLGGTDPIEIVSSDEEEENEVEWAIGAENDESEEDEEDEEDYLEPEKDYYFWKQGQSSSQQFFSPEKRRKYVQEDSGDDSEEGSEGDEEGPINIVSDNEIDDGEDRGHQEQEEWSMEELEEGHYEEEEEVRLGKPDLHSHASRIRTPRHFHYTDREETEDGPEIVEDDDGIEEIRPPEANTAFQLQVPHSSVRADSPIEIPNPWVGPRIDAEDPYKAGDGRPSRLDSNHLGHDDNHEGIQDVTDDKSDGDEMQVAEQDTSFPFHDEEQRPVNISGPCVGPQTYTEDFYAADVRTRPAQDIDPTLLESTVRDDIGVPSAAQIVNPDGEDYEEDVMDDEDELEHDEEAVIQPPTQHMFAPTSRLARRALPIPANAEFISIDDSDEETSLEDQKLISLEPLKVVEMEFQELQHEDVDEQNIEREQSVEVDGIIKEDTVYMHKAIPPLGSAPPSEADIPIITWPLASSSDQQDDISMDYESLYANIEAVTVQPGEQPEVISTDDWNYPPSFPAGILTSASGHLATPSSEESNANLEESVVQTMGTLINSLESVDKESSSHTLVHEEVITQSEKNLAKVLVENPETLVDQAIPEPLLVENSEPQLMSPTLALVDDMVNDKQIAEHGEGVTDEETARAHKIDAEITSGDVGQLIDEKESAPAQQSSEDTVDDEIDLRDVDTSMQETKIIDANSHVAAANTEDDISPSSEEVDEESDNQTQPFASTSSVQNPVPVSHHHAYDFDQLPTPPPDRTPTAQSPVTNDGPSSAPTSPLRSHRVQMEEVEDEDDIRPQPFSADSVELDLRIDIESTGEPYTVVEPGSHDEYTDENADGDGEIEFDVEVVSMSSVSQMWDEARNEDGGTHLSMDYVVEEPLTDGRLTEEPTTVTPGSIHSQALDELVHTPNVSSTPVEALASIPNADLLTDIGLGIDQAIEQIEAPLQSRPIGTEAMDISNAQPSENIHAKTSHDGPISTPLPADPGPPVSMNITLTRKPTDPILVSDPYPYSLSTPGVSLMDPTEEDSEHDNSMSSSSTLGNTNNETDELELQYPLEPNILAELNVGSSAKGEEASKVADEAANADAHGGFNSEPVAACLPQSSAQIQQADLPTSDGTVAPGLINSIEKDDVSSEEVLPIEPAKEISSALTETVNHNLPEVSTTPTNGIAGDSASTQASKRKRDSSPPHLEKVAPTTTTDKAEKGKNKKVSKLNGKGKAKATDQEVIDQATSQATIHVKPRRKIQPRALPKNLSETWTASRSSSGASATYKMLLPSSPSSVASSVPSDQSVAVVALPSPTVHKPNVPLVQTSLQPVSLFHAHGQKRSNQNNQPQPSQARTHPIQPPMHSIRRVISLPRINDSSSTAASPTTAISPTVVTSPTPVTPPVIMKAVPPPAVRHTPAISGSPVTRSHCRYHRISLPKEEGGPRIRFLVPGCSLNDKELMTAEEIEDHGDATYKDSLRMIKDIQSLDFDSYLIGTLRQLVGLDILREQEVFYLPQPGEEVVRKTSPRKERSGVFGGADSSSYAGSPGYSGGSMRSPGSMKAPTSLADSTSTSFSAFRRRRLDSEKGSASVYSDTELEPSDGEPDAKRARPSPPNEQGPMGPPVKAQGKRQLRSRHSKQIEEVREGNLDDAQSRIVGKRPSKLGVKRRRGSEIMAKVDGEERLPKKLKIKIHTSAGASTT